jgi:hypothetical protein
VGIALFKKVSEKMVPTSEPSVEDGQQDAAIEGNRKLTRDEIAAELDTAEQANRDLLSVGNRLALSSTAIPAAKQKLLQDSFAQQGKVMDRLLQHIQSAESNDESRLTEDKERLELMSTHIGHELSPPALPLPSTRPFLDTTLQDLIKRLAANVEELRAAGSRLPTASRQVSEIRYTAPLETARTGIPRITTWSPAAPDPSLRIPSQIELPYSEMVSPKTAHSRPGGIVIGNSARLESGVDLSGYVLRYDLRNHLLVLSGPSRSEFSYPRPIDPEVMKSLYRFAYSNKSAAISLANPPVRGIQKLVRLDNAFVDSSVGRDLIAADLVAWRLSLVNLPDRRLNPLAGDFIRAETMIAQCMQKGGSATLIDDRTAIGISDRNLVLGGGLRMEFMADVDDEVGCAEMVCKSNPSGGKTCHLTGMERLAKENYHQIMDLFPPLARIDEYARVIGFLRWARISANVGATDFSALINVPAGTDDHRTPDALTN